MSTPSKDTDSKSTNSTPVKRTDSSPVKSTNSTPIRSNTSDPVKSSTSAPAKKTDSSSAKSTDSSPAKRTDSSSAKSTSSSPAKKTDSSPAKKTDSSPAKSTDSSPAKRTDSSSAKSTSSSPAKKTDSSPAKKTDSSPAKKTDSSPAKKTDSSSAKSTSSSPAKRTDSSSAKSTSSLSVKSTINGPVLTKKVPASSTGKDKWENSRVLIPDEGVKRVFRLYVNRRKEMTVISINGYTMKTDVYGKSTEGKAEKAKLNRVKNEENRYLTDRTDKKFMFWITIPSVCYLGKITVPAPDGKGTLTLTFKVGEEVTKYFRRIHRQQLGQHIFVTPNGCIGTIGTYLDTGGPYVCATEHVISSLYPCIQNHFEKKDEDDTTYKEVQNELVLGLRFMEYLDHWTWFPAPEMKKHSPNDVKGPFFHQIGQDYFRFDQKPYGFRKRKGNEDGVKKGQRYYSRFTSHNHPTNTGNVHEITEKYLEVLYDERSSVEESDVRFAVYVCQGAKLLVQDNYHEFPVIRKFSKSKHNRSLVLQGGLVMIQGKGSEVSFNLPFHSSFHDLKRRKSTPLFNASLEQLVDLALLDMSASNKKRIKDIKRPVIFIGANESDYDTICWKLQVERDSITADTKPVDNTICLGRFCALTIPEDGRIVAIEEWSEGIEEVWCRHRYEQLYQSVVSLKDDNDFSYASKGFCLPTNGLMFRKILGAESESRVIDCNLTAIPAINKLIESRPQSDVQPVEFNFSRPSLVRNQIGPLINLKHCRPFAHPAYPPIKLSGRQKSLCYPPAKLEIDGQVSQIDPVYECYYLDQNFRTKSDCLKWQKSGKLELAEMIVPEYIWKRYTGQAKEDGQPVDRVVNDMKYRLGCDGCYYQKTEEPIGKYKTLYYKLVQSQERED